MSLSFLDLSKLKINENYKVYFTYDDIKHLPTYPESPTIEIFDGELIMPPSPDTKHQTISFNLSLLIGSKVKKESLGRVFTAPIDVVFSDKDVCVPDFLFINKERLHLITDKNISGAPDFIIEILSTNRTNDLVSKKEIYQKYKVKEYWIIDPKEEAIITFELGNDIFIETSKLTKDNGVITSKVIGISIPIPDIFEK